MLLTMGELYKEKHEAMPSPERIDKVMSLTGLDKQKAI